MIRIPSNPSAIERIVQARVRHAGGCIGSNRSFGNAGLVSSLTYTMKTGIAPLIAVFRPVRAGSHFKFVTLALLFAWSGQSLGAGPVFRDDFDDASLQAGWTIVRPDTATYSLTAVPGFFRVLTARGLLGEQATAKNLLVRPASGNFILDTRLEFDPRDGQPFAGLLVYQDDAHAVSIGLVYASGERGEFRGVVMLNVGDNVDPNNRPASKYDEINSLNPGVVYLRLLRQADQFIGAYSDDGITFREVGTVTNALNDSLTAGVGAAIFDSEACGPACDVPIPALFDYFQISDLEGGGGLPGEGTLLSVEIEGPEEVVAGGTATFRAIANFEGGESRDVSAEAEWVVAPPDAGTMEDGAFRAALSKSERMATIVATFTQSGASGEITRTNAELVRIKPGTSGASGRMCGAGLVLFLPILILPLALRGVRRRRDRLIFQGTNAE